MEQEFYFGQEFNQEDVISTNQRVGENLEVYSRFVNEHLFSRELPDEIVEFIDDERDGEWLEPVSGSRAESACVGLVFDTVENVGELEKYLAAYIAWEDTADYGEEFVESDRLMENAEMGGVNLYYQSHDGSREFVAQMIVPEEFCLAYRLEQELEAPTMDGVNFRGYS